MRWFLSFHLRWGWSVDETSDGATWWTNLVAKAMFIAVESGSRLVLEVSKDLFGDGHRAPPMRLPLRTGGSGGFASHVEERRRWVLWEICCNLGGWCRWRWTHHSSSLTRRFGASLPPDWQNRWFRQGRSPRLLIPAPAIEVAYWRLGFHIVRVYPV